MVETALAPYTTPAIAETIAETIAIAETIQNTAITTLQYPLMSA